MAIRKATQSQNITPSTKLLKPAEVTFCKKLSRGKTLLSQRAKALLALHAGATQSKAGEAVGLTLDQVKYCIRRFRVHGLKIFSIDNKTKKAPPKVSAARRPAKKVMTNKAAAEKTAAKKDKVVRTKEAKKPKKVKSKKDPAEKAKAKKPKNKSGQSTRKGKKKKSAKPSGR